MTRKRATIIGWSQLLGSLGGIYLLIPAVRFQHVPVGLVWYGGTILCFLVAAFAGWRLLLNRRWGHELSLAVQAAQVLRVTAGGWAYAYATGLELPIRVTASEFGLHPGVKAIAWAGPILPPSQPSPWALELNLFALWAAIYLARALGARGARSVVASEPQARADGVVGLASDAPAA